MSATPHLSVILPTRNPHAGRLARTLAGLVAQTLERSRWEILLVDNGSDRPFEPDFALISALPGFRRLQEPTLGLTPARLCGIRAAHSEILVFVDDDNVLAPDYLAQVVRLFAAHPKLAAAGGIVQPEWETSPPEWSREFHGLLALRDCGPRELVCTGGAGARWPDFAPVGAGLIVRRAGALGYADALAHDPQRRALDRRGTGLGSGGDNDLVFTLLHAGGEVAYFPELRLTHLIPSGRLEPDYLARLNEGIQRTWVRVLALHGQCPWPSIPPWTLPLRAARAWWRESAWRSPVHYIRWRGLVGRFAGLADLRQSPPPAP